MPGPDELSLFVERLETVGAHRFPARAQSRVMNHPLNPRGPSAITAEHRPRGGAFTRFRNARE